MLLQTCTNLLFVIVVMTTITKEHFLKFVAYLYGANVATNLLQTGFALLRKKQVYNGVPLKEYYNLH